MTVQERWWENGGEEMGWFKRTFLGRIRRNPCCWASLTWGGAAGRRHEKSDEEVGEGRSGAVCHRCAKGKEKKKPQDPAGSVGVPAPRMEPEKKLKDPRAAKCSGKQENDGAMPRETRPRCSTQGRDHLSALV